MKSKLMLALIFVAFALCVWFQFSPAFAAEPVLQRPLSSGLIFPSLADSVTGNAAALTQHRASTYRVTRTGPAGEVTVDSYTATVAAGRDKWGFGASVNGYDAIDGLTLGMGGVGAALAFSGFSLGANARFSLNSDLVTASSIDYDANLLAGNPNGFQFGAKVSSVQSLSTQGVLTVGIGWAKRRTYQTELNFTRPLSSNPVSGNTLSLGTVSAMGPISLGIFGSATSASTSEFTPSSYAYGANASLSLGRNFGIDALYSISSEVLRLGVSLSF